MESYVQKSFYNVSAWEWRSARDFSSILNGSLKFFDETFSPMRSCVCGDMPNNSFQSLLIIVTK